MYTSVIFRPTHLLLRYCSPGSVFSLRDLFNFRITHITCCIQKGNICRDIKLCSNVTSGVTASDLPSADEKTLMKCKEYRTLLEITTRLENQLMMAHVSASVCTAYTCTPLSQINSALSNENMLVVPKSRPPDCVRGMTKLDRSAFSCHVTVAALKIPVIYAEAVSKKFKDRLLRIPKLKALADLGEVDPDRVTHKLLLFDPTKLLTNACLTAADRDCLAKFNIGSDAWQFHEVILTYDNWTYDEILDAVLPSDQDKIGGFSTIGHIAHFNLRDHHADYKNIIGEVILDKIPYVKTVVNKTNIIDNTYRNFQMEVLAGEHNFVTVTKEHGFAYEFDFSKVYWNSRLSTEHQRIVSLLHDGDIVYDVFAGVGPFAIPAARKRCVVFANDLNPESYRWLQHNVKLNRIKTDVHTYNMDGREFVRKVVRSDLLTQWRLKDDVRDPGAIHVVMNLPALAVEFLDTFRGLFDREELTVCNTLRLPTVHCYSFSKSDDPVADVRLRTETALGCSLPPEHSVRFVRNVAPGKDMFCLTFVIPLDVLCASDVSNSVKDSCKETGTECVDEPAEKKPRICQT